LLFLLGSSPAFAQVGKITGVVTDAQTGEPLAGVQVYLEGTGRGALTSENGRYFIVNVEPGTYVVVAELLGYQTTRVENVRVSIDITRQVNFELTPQAIAVGEIRVEVESTPLIETQATGTRDFISLRDITSLPVTTINEALSLRSGFLEVPQNTDILSLTEEVRGITPVRIRGGRNGETLALIDGVPVNNFLFGGPAFQPTPYAIQQLDFIRGGFEAQYGNALSGIINIATREGGTELRGAVEYRTSEIAGELGSDPDALADNNLFQGYVSGPVPGTQEKLRFAVSARENHGASRVLEFDDEAFDPRFRQPELGFAQPNQLDLWQGWRSFGFDEFRDITAKLTILPTPTAKLNATIINYQRQTQPFLFDLLLTEGDPVLECIDLYGDAEMCNKAYGGSRFDDVAPGSVKLDRSLYILRWDHTIGRTFYDVVASRFDQSRETCNWFNGVCLEDRFANTNFNENFQAPGITTDHPTAGTGRFFGGEDVTTYMVRADIQSQVSDHHNVAAGVMYQTHNIDFLEKRDRGISDVLVTEQVYFAEPWELGFYLQDRIEYDFITIRLGFRVDLGRAASPGLMFANPLDPTNGTTALDVCADPTNPKWQNKTVRVFNEETGQAETVTVSANRDWSRDFCTQNRSALDSATLVAFSDDMTEAKRRSQFSPRLGITFPVTANSNLFFNFSRFTQNPLYNNQFQGTSIGTPREGTVKGPQIFNTNFNVPFLGNPNLVIEETTSYEVGYLAELFDDYALSLILFSKDQNGLTGVRIGGLDEKNNQIFDEGVTYGTNTPSYSVLVNQDFTTVQGVEISIRKRLTGFWNFDLNYQLSEARTNASPPERQFERLNEGDPLSAREVRSEIDQRHVFNGSFRVIFGDETPWGSGFWHQLLRNTTSSIIVRVASGLPYTPTPPGSELLGFGGPNVRQELNSGTAPTTFRMDLLLQKNFWVSNVQYGLFLQVVNLTDAKNCIQVSPATGKCDQGAFDFLRRRVGNPVGEGASSTLLDRPQWIGARRQILFGARIGF
jgi:outer membrane receptor protein involved in Fe transport